MATLNINGKRVKVDDSFLSLSPEQQNATVDEIAKSLGGGPVQGEPGTPGNPTVQSPAYQEALNAASNPFGAENAYKIALKRVRDTYYPKATDEQWTKIASDNYKPYDAGQIFNAGLTFGFNDEAAGAGNAVADFFRGIDPVKSFQDFTALERARQKLGAEKAGPLGVAAEVGGAMLAGRPDMAAGKAAGLLPAMWDSAKGGAVSGGLYGFGSTDGSLVDRSAGAAKGAVGGAAIGAAVPATVAGVKRVISPARAPQAKTNAANVLRNEGVELTAGQATGNKKLQYREAELGGTAADDFMERQAEQFTSAALKRVNVNATRATHDVIDAGDTAIGQMFDDTASRNTIQTDQRLAVDMQKAWRRFEGVTNPSTRPKVIERMLEDIYGRGYKGGYRHLSGEWYKSTRSELGRLSKSQNPELAEAARDMMAALDDAMERTIAKVNPADLGAWREARRLYKNMLVIKDAATRAGAASAEGLITPQALRSAAIRQNKNAFARGRNEFVDLADAGVTAMTPLPNSGTPGRLGAKLFVPAGAATGAGIGGMVAGPVGAGVGAVAGAAVPWAAGKALMSGPGRAYLTNQLAAKPVGGLAALIGSSVGRGVQPLLSQN